MHISKEKSSYRIHVHYVLSMRQVHITKDGKRGVCPLSCQRYQRKSLLGDGTSVRQAQLKPRGLVGARFFYKHLTRILTCLMNKYTVYASEVVISQMRKQSHGKINLPQQLKN